MAAIPLNLYFRAKFLGPSKRPKFKLWPYGVLVPLGAIFVLFNLLPLIGLFGLSFQNWSDVVADRSVSLTLDNYFQLIEDPVFYKTFANTALFTVVRVPLSLLLGLLVALGLRQTILFRPFFASAWFSPFMTSAVAIALVFSYLYNPSYGLFNYVLNLVGLPSQGFLQDPSQALLSIAFVDLWKNVGFNVVVFMAGLAGIPVEFDEVSRIDGASRLQNFWYITLPLLSRTSYLLLVIGVITSMRVFVTVYMMSGFSLSSGGLGGPLGSTRVLALYVYESAFRFNNFSYAAAIAIILFVVVLFVTVLQIRVLKPRWEY